jgi:23S rRNA (cytosine1962-C5)-methyltransferase
MSFPVITLQKNAHRRLASGHPWIYSNEMVMDPSAKAIASGTMVEVRAADGHFLGRGHYNPHTLIAARLLTREKEEINAAFWEKKLQSALNLRETLFDKPYYRLVHAEADGFPGLIIDRFNDVLVVQPNTSGMQQHLNDILDAAEKILKAKTIILRGDTQARGLEGLGEDVQVLRGAKPDSVQALENGFTYQVDVIGGQKTGWFYDQRRNRRMVAELAAGKNVLDLYTHTGGFGLLAAQKGAASVVCVDSSAPSLALAEGTMKAAKLDNVTFAKADVFDFLPEHKGRYEIVVADPPAFAKSKKDVPTASKGYRKLAKGTAKLVKAGGFLFIASCSHAITREKFDEEILGGVADAGRSPRVLARTGADMDHPAHPQLNESVYLKGILLAVE